MVYQRDLGKSITFYRDVLGLRLSDFVHLTTPQGKLTAVFFHCNPRHHSIAFIETPPLPKRINHFMVEYGWGGRSVDDSTWQVQHWTSGSIWGHPGLNDIAAKS